MRKCSGWRFREGSSGDSNLEKNISIEGTLVICLSWYISHVGWLDA